MIPGPEVAKVTEEFRVISQEGKTAHAIMTRHPASRLHLLKISVQWSKRWQPILGRHNGSGYSGYPIASPAAVDVVLKAKLIGKEQFQYFTRERLLERITPIDNTHRNKLKVFKALTTKSVSKRK